MKKKLVSCLLGVVLYSSFAAAASASRMERTVLSVLPALTYGSKCMLTAELTNLGDRPVILGVEGHRSSGALVQLMGQSDTTLHLNPSERVSYKLEVEEDSASAWIKVAEIVPSPLLSPVVAVAGITECISGDQLRTTVRDLAYPTLNPWFSGETAQIRGGEILVINTSERAAKAWLCYSEGNLYALPAESGPGSQLMPICSTDATVQIPPFGTRQFPVQHEGSSFFSLKTEGAGMVLQMLRPAGAAVKTYTVNSTITFGEEALPPAAR